MNFISVFSNNHTLRINQYRYKKSQSVQSVQPGTIFYRSIVDVCKLLNYSAILMEVRQG